MNIFLFGFIVIFVLFVIILIANPRISCFGKKIRSPFYPLLRKKKRSKGKETKIDDYGFSLSDKKKTNKDKNKKDEKK